MRCNAGNLILLSGDRMLILSPPIAQGNAIYDCLWLGTSSRINSYNRHKDWPCALSVVTEYASLTGNQSLVKSTDMSRDACKGIITNAYLKDMYRT